MPKGLCETSIQAYTQIGNCHVYQGDCLEVVPEIASKHGLFDSCVCDPPYHLSSIVKRFGGKTAAACKVNPDNEKSTGAYARASRGFMGQTWDGGDVAFRVETWRKVYDALKPGAYLVAFSGTRTYHRMAVAIEDAGFEIRDCLFWCYGTGFPKSHNISKAIDKAAGAKRKKKRVKNPGNPKAHGRGRDGAHGATRPWIEEAKAKGYHEIDNDDPVTAAAAAAWDGFGTALKPALEPICLARKPLSEKTIAANVLKHGTGALNIDACRIGSSGARNNGRKVDSEIYGKMGQVDRVDYNKGRWPANFIHDDSLEVTRQFPYTSSGEVKPLSKSKKGSVALGEFKEANVNQFAYSEGSASRFFYSAKAGPLDRIGTGHATVKPVDLMRWLVRLVTPPQGCVLDLFAGSGTTGIAAGIEGFSSALIDVEPEHYDDIIRKLTYLRGGGAHKIKEHQAAKIARAKDKPLGGLFAQDLPENKAAS